MYMEVTASGSPER